jgi:hypothetical protein
MKLSARFWLLSIISVFTVESYALSLNQLEGSFQQLYRSPQGLTEYCVIPKRWPRGYYREDDSEKENELCRYNFYSNVGICPKYNSTNPGILLLKPNDKYSKEAIDASNCDVDSMGVKTEAKFKQSISCSYTPSILAYYQMSRILGIAGRVPVAVIRTMDFDVHNGLTDKANRYLRGSREVIAQTWANYAKVHRRPRDYPTLVDNSLTQLYGALADNIKNEEKYTEVSGKGSYDSRYQRFLKQPPFLKVSSSQSVESMVGSREFTRVAQTVTQMKDVSDMVVLDTLLGQQDRIGNIHYKAYWYWLGPQGTGRIERTKSDAKIENGKWVIPPEESRAMAGKTASLVKEMLLRDNDCGVVKTNMMRKISALEKVRHVSYLTYRELLVFERGLALSSTRDYFLREMLFTLADYKTLQANAKKAREILHGNCRAGRLRFDVDLQSYIPGGTVSPRSCEVQ